MNIRAAVSGPRSGASSLQTRTCSCRKTTRRLHRDPGDLGGGAGQARVPGVAPWVNTPARWEAAAGSDRRNAARRRLGDLNPGRARTLTALAARVAVVRIGSSWTNATDRSFLDGGARW